MITPSQINAIIDMVDAVIDVRGLSESDVEKLISLAAGVSVELHEYDDLTVVQADAIIEKLENLIENDTKEI